MLIITIIEFYNLFLFKVTYCTAHYYNKLSISERGFLLKGR